MESFKDILKQTSSEVSIFKLTVYLIIIIFCISYMISKIEANYNNHTDWTVKYSNGGFVLAINPEGEEVVVRNPLPNIESGDLVTIAGFAPWASQELPYVRSEIYIDNTTY